MLQLRLEEPFNQVFVGLRLENPLTGESTIVDAKIDTGAVVTTVPKEYVEDFGLEILDTRTLRMANGMSIPAYVCLCDVSLTDEEVVQLPIHVVDSTAGYALVGMDFLQLCDYAQWHEKKDGKTVINFKVELYDE